MSPAWLNPDCLGGKCTACAGDAWDFDTDQPARCACTCHGPRTLRAITVRQPWAWAIVHGGKDVENRSRNIAGGYRGAVAIHAAKAVSVSGYNDLNVLAAMVADAKGRTLTDGVRGVLGAIVGVVDLVDVHRCPNPECDDPWGTPPVPICSDWAQQGHHHLTLANPRPLAHPIPAKGRLGLWIPGGALQDAIWEQVAA